MKKATTAEDVVKMLKQQQGGRSLREYAKDLGITAAYLCDIYYRRRNPGPRVLRRFRLHKEVKTTTTYTSDSKAAD